MLFSIPAVSAELIQNEIGNEYNYVQEIVVPSHYNLGENVRNPMSDLQKLYIYQDYSVIDVLNEHVAHDDIKIIALSYEGHMHWGISAKIFVRNKDGEWMTAEGTNSTYASGFYDMFKLMN